MSEVKTETGSFFDSFKANLWMCRSAIKIHKLFGVLVCSLVLMLAKCSDNPSGGNTDKGSGGESGSVQACQYRCAATHSECLDLYGSCVNGMNAANNTAYQVSQAAIQRCYDTYNTCAVRAAENDRVALQNCGAIAVNCFITTGDQAMCDRDFNICKGQVSGTTVCEATYRNCEQVAQASYEASVQTLAQTCPNNQQRCNTRNYECLAECY